MKRTIIVPKHTPKDDEKQKIAKIEQETDVFRPKLVGRELGTEIMKRRTEKGLKQKDLAGKINVLVGVIASFENGTALYDNNIIQKLQKALGTKFIHKPK